MFVILALLLLMPVAAFAQEPQQPTLADLSTVMYTDFNRAASELTSILRLAKETTEKAKYWEDACRSTKECGGDDKH